MPMIPDHLAANPLVNPRPLPYGAFPFDEIKPEHFKPAVDWALDVARARIDAIKANRDRPGFENTVAELAFASEELDRIAGQISVFKGSMNTAEVQKAYDSIRPGLSRFSTDVLLDGALFDRIRDVYDRRDMLGLNEEESILLDKTYHGFANNGAALEGEARARFKKLSLRLSALSSRFQNNLVNHTAKLHVLIPAVQSARLDGVPQDALNFYKKVAEKAGHPGDYLIPMSPPPMAILENAKDRSLREEVFKTLRRRGTGKNFGNSGVFREVLKVRHELAQLLGFENHADRTIATGHRMTDDYRDILDFTHRNAAVYKAAAEPFYDGLAEDAREDGIAKMEGWDRTYYIRQRRERDVGLKVEEVKPYFELENCLQGVFHTAGELFGIDLKEATGKYPVWHPDVRVFEVSDRGRDGVQALFYADFFARDGKNSGAWMQGLRNSSLFRGERVMPIASNNMNLMRQDGAVLLTPDNVTTLFHEFGHACHCLTGRTGVYSELQGTNTSRDYVETPSQFVEVFAFKDEVLAIYARHHKTGEMIPAALADKIRRGQSFDNQWQGLRQAEFGLIDMAAHTTDPAQIGNLKAFERTTLAPYSVGPETKGAPQFASFSHLIGGYSAGYYVYKWADALVADVAAQFEKREANGEGPFPPDLCRAFADCMIRPGGTRHGARMLADFKRAAGCNDLRLDPLALFRAEGITVPPGIEAEILRRHNAHTPS